MSEVQEQKKSRMNNVRGLSIETIRKVGGFFGNNGDFSKIEEAKIKAEKNSGKWEVRNYDRRPRYMEIPLDQIIALETQRIASDSWAIKVLNKKQGLDMLAFGTIDVRFDKGTIKYKHVMNNEDLRKSRIHGLDKNDKNGDIFSTFDGNGRTLLLEAMREEILAKDPNFKVQCMVYDITPEEAMELFAFRQKEGNRTMSSEVLGSNQYWSKLVPKATELGEVLDACDLFMRGDARKAVPYAEPLPETLEVKYNTIANCWEEVSKYYDKPFSIQLLKDATDMVIASFPDDYGKEHKKRLQQQLVYALVGAFLYHPTLYTDSKLKARFQKYLKNQSLSNTASQFVASIRPTKAAISGSGISISMLGYYILMAFADAKGQGEKVKNVITRVGKFQPYITVTTKTEK